MIHDADSGALEAVDLRAARSDGTFASVLDFRFDPGRRRALTERTLAEHSGGVPRSLIEAIGATLESGAAIFAVLHEGGTATVLEDAVAVSRAADRRRAGRCPRTRAGRPAAARGCRPPDYEDVREMA